MGTTVEVEVKARVEELGPVRQGLLGRGAKPVEEVRQEDTYFDHPVRSFADTDEALRVRSVEDPSRCWITYKGPRQDVETKTREEIEIEVEDPERAASLLCSLGFEPAGTVTKQREVLSQEELTVVLDRVEGLGCFVEIEAVVETEAQGSPAEAAAREQVLGLADELGLEEIEPRSYLELVLEEDADGGDQ